MNTYKVTLTQSWLERGTVTVEAIDEADAKAQAVTSTSVLWNIDLPSPPVVESVELIPTPPPPPPIIGNFTPGTLPADGFHATTNWPMMLTPKIVGEIPSAAVNMHHLASGVRLAGVVSFMTHCRYTSKPPSVPYRLLVDGYNAGGMVVDTIRLTDGTHVFGIQIMDPGTNQIRGGSRIFVVNNSGLPLTSLEGQTVVNKLWDSGEGLAWGRVNVLDNQPYPLDPQLDRHPLAVTDADRTRLATERIWWVEGLNHVSTPLWRCMPILAKNKQGDVFIEGWNPEGGEAATQAINALPYVEAAPALDGPRGIGIVSPYCSISTDKYSTDPLAGWRFITKAGQIGTVDLTGKVTTIFGPRSVPSVVPYDPFDITCTLDQRLASGEKEFVGDLNGTCRLKMPHDMWQCDSFPFEAVVADFRERFPAIATLGAEEVKALLQGVKDRLMDLAVTSSKNRELHQNLY